MDIQNILTFTIFGNTAQQHFTAGAFLIFFLLVIRFALPLVFAKFQLITERTKSEFDDILLQVFQRIPRIFYVLFAFLITLKFFLKLSTDFEIVVNGVLLILIVFELIRMAQAILFYCLQNSSVGKDKTSLQGVKMITKFFLWALGVLIVLSNLGFDITALAASFGIGGIAVALAAQNILGDLFASFTLYFDKPFAVGDYIILANLDGNGTQGGVVQKIGLKTTRIKTLQGEELVVSNKELTETRVRNFKQLKRRRVQFGIGVTYDTPEEKLARIPEIIKNIVEAVELAEFDRAHFKEFSDSSLNFDIVYFVDSSLYVDYMDTQQDINLKIVKAFHAEGINMAFPTRTIYMKQGD